MAKTLTPKQERFCVEYVKTGNASEAYRRAYDAEGMKPEVVAVKASELLKNGKVAVRLAELRAPVVAEARYGLKEAMDECAEAMNLARATEQAGAFVSAVALRAKLAGLLVERREQGKPGEFADLKDKSEAELEEEARALLADGVRAGIIKVMPRAAKKAG
jgi:phage terminase small subunit